MVSQYVLSGMTPFERDIIEKKTIPAIIAHLDALKEDSGSSVPRIWDDTFQVKIIPMAM